MSKVAAKKTAKKSPVKEPKRSIKKKTATFDPDIPLAAPASENFFSSYEPTPVTDFFQEEPEQSFSPDALVPIPSFKNRLHSFFKKCVQKIKAIRINKQTLKNKWVIGPIIALLLALTLYGIFGGTSSAPDNEKIVQMVSRHMLLPEGEVPIIMSIGEAEKLASSQAFFALAENGDYLLVFERTGKAIIYSPNRDLIINSGSIAKVNNTAPTTPTKK